MLLLGSKSFLQIGGTLLGLLELRNQLGFTLVQLLDNRLQFLDAFRTQFEMAVRTFDPTEGT